MLESTVGTDGKTFEVDLSTSRLTFKEARRLRDELTAALRDWKLHAYDRRKNIRTRETAEDDAAMSLIHRAANELRKGS